MVPDRRTRTVHRYDGATRRAELSHFGRRKAAGTALTASSDLTEDPSRVTLT